MNHNVGIIYFHGYGSSPNTDKVAELRKHFSEVHAFPIDVDPSKSLPYLEEEIDHILASNINSEKPLIFVGTSLGAWYAGRLAKLFHSPCVLINPCYSFEAVKTDLGVSPEIKAKYEALGFEYPEGKQTTFFLADNDEVIDFEKLYSHLIWDRLHLVEGADHRFNGEPFEQVIEFLKSETF